MTHRKYSIRCLVILAGFILVNFIIWKAYTEDLLSKHHEGGDMTRVGYISGSKLFRHTFVDLPKKHFDMADYRGQKIDVLTIGDSFSAGGGFGRNPYYQDYLATIHDFTVCNVGPFPTDDLYMFFQPLSTLEVLYNSGYLDVIKPRYVLIESVVRYSIRRFSKPFTFSRTEALEKVRAHYGKRFTLTEAPGTFFINSGNFKFVLNSLLYRYSDNAFADTIHVRKLIQPFFSVDNADTLLFLHEDIKYLKEVNQQSMALLNDNFNRIADLLRKKGIQLLYMPIVDKYDLYRDYLVTNPYPGNRYFELLRKMPRRYTLIDTKEILSKSLRNGEIDVYFPDDSHWNWKAAQTVFENVVFD